jgi:thiol:disulfide interchange protein DsbD
LLKHLTAILLAVLVSVAGHARAAPVSTGHVQLELVPAAAQVAPGQSLYVALHEKIVPGWHTYWRNPGDAGEPPQISWTLPAGWSAGDIVWPAPNRLPVGPLMDYGYENEVYLPIQITAPKTAGGGPARLKASVSILVCKDICIPEDATLQLDLPVKPGAAGGVTNAAVAKALASAPRTAPLQAVMAASPTGLKLAVTGAPLKGARPSDVYFFPYDSTIIDHAKPEQVERGSAGLTLSMAPGYALKKGEPPNRLRGVLKIDGAAYEIIALPGPMPAAATGLGPLGAASPDPARGPDDGARDLSLPLAAAFAFLGGLILNLMPCVFPILSMKALALARHSDAASRPRAHGLAFVAGVLATFVGLAAALIAAKAAGSAVGWGFQLQSPAVVAGLALLMLLIGLNLSGVFEAGLSLQSAGSGAAHHEGMVGSALTGVLAVVVAAPCTAPFMAGAIAYALTQSEGMALVIFAALGLGFAAPFTLLSFAPGLLRRLPPPGPWMEALKKVLAFPMYGAAAWLTWVMTLQAGTTALAALLAAGVALALAAWLYGAAQRSQISGRRPGALYVLSAASVAAAVALTFMGITVPAPMTPKSSGSSEAMAPEPFSPERLSELQAQGKPVFVNFTAAWCITCQVNEKAALSSPKVAQAFAQAGMAYLKGDWTRRDAVIARALAEHGRAGVPLYLVYGADGGEPQVLPQILTEGDVIAAVNKASGKT